MAVVALFTYLGFTLYIRPKRQMRTYAAQMRKLGYRVYEYPFAFLGASYGKRLQADLKEHKDIFWTLKHILPQYDIMLSNALGEVYIYFISPEIVKHINTIDKAILLEKSSIVMSMLHYRGDEGLVTAGGMLWKNHRKLVANTFNYDFVKSQVPSITRITNIVFERAVKEGKTTKGGVEVDLSILFSKITSKVVLTGFLGIESFGSEERSEDQLETILRDLMDNIVKMGTTDPLVILGGGDIVERGLTARHRSYTRHNHIFRRWMKSHVERIREEVKAKAGKKGEGCYQPATLIEAILLEGQNQTGTEQYNEKQLLDEIMTFILAGTDTTFSFLCFLATEVAKRPEILRKIQQEID